MLQLTAVKWRAICLGVVKLCTGGLPWTFVSHSLPYTVHCNSPFGKAAWKVKARVPKNPRVLETLLHSCAEQGLNGSWLRMSICPQRKAFSAWIGCEVVPEAMHIQSSRTGFLGQTSRGAAEIRGGILCTTELEKFSGSSCVYTRRARFTIASIRLQGPPALLELCREYAEGGTKVTNTRWSPQSRWYRGKPRRAPWRGSKGAASQWNGGTYSQAANNSTR